MSPIENYHAHIYYDANTRAAALALCESAGSTFGIKVGRMHDNPVGPHPRGSCQLTIGLDQFDKVIPWLVLNRRGLTVFTHAQTRRCAERPHRPRNLARPLRDTEAFGVPLSHPLKKGTA